MSAEENLSGESRVSSDVEEEIIKFNYEFVVGTKKNSKFLYLIDEKQLFRKNEVYKGTVTYKCIENTCKSRMCVKENGDCVKPKKVQQHNHGSNEKKRQELQVLNDIKDEFMKPSSVCFKPKKIFDMNVVS